VRTGQRGIMAESRREPERIPNPPNVAPVAPLYRFSLWATTRPDDHGYSMTNWDYKESITVLASNREEAYRKAEAALGQPPRGRLRVFKVRDIVDHRIQEEK
jgi:hypothetical protein